MPICRDSRSGASGCHLSTPPPGKLSTLSTVLSTEHDIPALLGVDKGAKRMRKAAVGPLGVGSMRQPSADHEVGAPCRTRGTVLQAWGSFFMCRFFSLDKEKKRRKKRNSTGIMAIADEPLRLVEVLFGPFSFKKKERRLSIKTYLNRLSSPAPPSTACPPPGR